MAVGQFLNAQLLAQRLITKFGRKVTFRQTSTTPSNPAEPWLGVTADTNKTGVSMVFIEYDNKERAGSLVQEGDKKVLVAHLDLGLRPSTKDKLLDGGIEWNIVSIKTTEPGERTETVMYELQVRS
jgi:hypothetical protein